MYRQRAEEPVADSNSIIATDTAPAGPNTAPVTSADGDENEEGRSVAEVLRLRNARKHRTGGVGFRAGLSSLGDDAATGEQSAEQGLVLHGSADAQQAADSAIIGGISKRFAPQTGLVGELVNRHM